MLPDDHANALETVVMQVSSNTYRRRWDYYIGQHPKIWATPKLRETFRDLADSLTENYCGLAINTRLSRLEVLGWDGDERAEAKWIEAGLPQRQDVMFRWGLVHGKAFLIVQDDQIAVNPATVAYAQPDPNDWLHIAWAGKALMDFDRGYWFAALWDEENIYRYRSATKTEYTPNMQQVDRLPAGEDFVLEDVERHGYEIVPVFELNPYGYQAAPLIDQIAPVQDKINKLSANKFVAAEFGAFKQRVFFTRQQLDPYAVRQQPDHAIVLDPGDADGRAAVQELGGTDIRVYDEAKNAEVDALFTIATLPRHLRVNPGTQVSGEAIKADEGPFTEALHDNQREFGEALRAAMACIGIDAEPLWRDVEANDTKTQVRNAAEAVAAGIPWQSAFTLFGGLTPEQVEAAEIAAQQMAAGTPIGQQTQAFLSNPLMVEGFNLGLET